MLSSVWVDRVWANGVMDPFYLFPFDKRSVIRSRMSGKKIRTILLALVLLVAAVVPAGAEEQTFELNIPGCTA